MSGGRTTRIPGSWPRSGASGLSDTGAWQASHAYTAGQTFTQAGLRYAVSAAYTSGTSFGATDTANALVLGPQTTGKANVPLTVYGHSFTTSPGQKCTSGAEFFKVLTTNLRLFNWTTYGVSGHRLIEQAYAAIGGAFLGASASAVVPAAPGGIYIIDALFNDYVNPATAGSFTPSALSTGQITGICNSLTAMLCLMSGAGRAEQPTAAPAGWSVSTSGTSGAYSGGQCLYGNTAAAAVTDTPTVPASGTLWALSYQNDPTNAAQATAVDSIGGTTVGTFNAATAPAYASLRSGDQAVTYTSAPVITTLTNCPVGAQTVTLTKDNTAGYFDPDCLIIPWTTPPLILVVLDPLPITGTPATAPVFNSPELATISANKTALDTAIKNTCAAWSNVVVLDTSAMPTSSHSYADGIHPNDRGMAWLADNVYVPQLTAWLAANDPDGLYTTL